MMSLASFLFRAALMPRLVALQWPLTRVCPLIQTVLINAQGARVQAMGLMDMSINVSNLLKDG